MSSGATENATQSAKNVEQAAAAARAHHGRTSAAAMASTASVNGRPPPERGSSKRSQSAAITKAARPERMSVLGMGRLDRRRAAQRGRKIVAGADDRDGHSSRMQAQKQRLPPSPRAVEARRVDIDD